MHRLVIAGLGLAGLAVAGGCSDNAEDPKDQPVQIDTAQLQAFRNEHNAPQPPVASTPELIALGDRLYHEKKLSAQGNLSCASCHDLSRAGQDGEPTSPGSTGVRGDRNSPTSMNAYRQIAQFWDGRATTVEEQAQGPVLNPIEHGLKDEAELVSILQGEDSYVAEFARAFPGQEDPITLANFGTAVGAFERTLKTVSPFDRYLAGDESALNEAQKAGLAKFLEVGCTSCHSGAPVGGGMFQKLGAVNPYPTEDKGQGAHTGNASQDYWFKVPMLLNVAETAPYFHDGSVKTLEEAVDKMAWHQLGQKLSKDDVASIVTFLGALTGTRVE